MSRRQLLQRAGVGGLILGAPSWLSACGSDPDRAGSTGGTTGVSGTSVSPGTTGGPGSTASPATTGAPPATGGTLKVAISWGQSETLDPQAVAGTGNVIARNFAVYQRLFVRAPQSGGGYDGVLAQSIEGNADATQYDIRLTEGVNWADGTPFVAEDVVYSLQRILTEELGLEGFGYLQMVDTEGIRKMDDLTVRVPLLYPYADFQAQLADRVILMVKDGTTSFETLNGTGPFQYVTTEQGRRIVLERNENYWRDGLPYLDQLEFINISDQTAAVNALQTGEVDVVEVLDPANRRIVEADGNLQVLSSDSGGFQPFVMDTSRAPFDDPDVRKAVRLLADRQKIIQAAQDGQGLLGNDLSSPFDPMYASDIPQREFDPDEAKFLLDKAGVDRFVLNTSDVGSGILPASLAFAQQCQEVGVNCETSVSPADSYWNNIWLKEPFFVSGWGDRSFASLYLIGLAPDAPQPETAWDDPASHKIFEEAMRTIDDAKRKELLGEVQQALWDDGGYVIWGFSTLVSGARDAVEGIEPNVNRQLNDFNFENVRISV